MSFNRRSFLGAGALGTVGALGGVNLAAAQESGFPKSRLAISSYSYWHFREPKVTIDTVIEKAADLGVGGVDVLHRQMDSEDVGYLRALKRRAFRHGVDLVCLSIHQDFVSPDAESRRENIEHTKHCIELASEMGIPSIRLNSGRWGTSGSFNELMARRGLEDPIPGYSDDDAFGWCIDSIEACLPHAERHGVVLALENHWGLTRTPEGLLRIANAIHSPWLGVLMDTGNFLEEPYEKLEAIASKTVFVQAKTYYGGGEWYTLDLDYARIGRILKEVGFRGYVSLEFEGKAPADDGVARSVSMLSASL